MFDNWLSPLKLQQFSDFNKISKGQWGKSLRIYYDEMPDLQGIKIAIVGVGDEEANEVRKHLYSMSFPFDGLAVADLGNVRKTKPAFLIPLITELLNSKIVPILIGNDVAIAEAQYLAYQPLKQLINLAVVDERIRYTIGGKDTEQYLNRIIDNPRTHLFHMALIGCQTHFVTKPVLHFLDDKNFEYARLGMVRSNMDQIEPLVRDADLLCFNIAALKQSEAPGQANPSPSGFFSEEACQISRYAGMSDKLSSAGFYGFLQDQDPRGQTAQVIAQLIWYFVDGFNQRKNDYPASSDSLVEYIVDFKNQDYQLTFWKSTKSGRWWMQIPVKTKKKHQRHTLIPCSYQDYQLASREDLPDRLLNAYKRFR